MNNENIEKKKVRLRLSAHKKKQYLVEHKGGRCFDCNNTFPDCCYDFDHRNPVEKLFGIGGHYGKPLAELVIEVDKCDLVCANCHRIRTAGDPVIAAMISAANKGKPSVQKGTSIPEERKDRIKAALVGTKRSVETKEKIRIGVVEYLESHLGPRINGHLRWHVNRNVVKADCVFCQQGMAR